MAETGSGTTRFHYLYSCDLDINIQIKMWVDSAANLVSVSNMFF